MITDTDYDLIASALHKAGKTPSEAREYLIQTDYTIRVNGQVYKDLYLKAILKRLHKLTEDSKYKDLENFEV